MSVARIERLAPSPIHDGNPLNALWIRVRTELTLVAAWVRQTRCALGGHDLLLRFEPSRISLHCVSCGHNTPGWTVGHRR